MFERFTDRARRVVVLAQEEARMLNHNYIGTEHILLGLINEGQGVAAKALDDLGISLEDARGMVEQIIGQGQAAPTGHIPFTPRAKKVLELSLREALQLGHNYIGTEHILLGLIREGEGVAAQVLLQLGAEFARVRQVVIQLLQSYAGTPEGKAGEFPEFKVAESVEHAERLHRVEEQAQKEAEALGERRVRADHRWVASLRLDIEEVTEALRKLQSALDRALEDIQRRRSEGGKPGEAGK
jgi:ATP-dependent Clp protease ATP-binding subunit ClpA